MVEEGYVRLADGSLIRVEYQLFEERGAGALTPRSGEMWLREVVSPDFALINNKWTIVCADGSERHCVAQPDFDAYDSYGFLIVSE